MKREYRPLTLMALAAVTALWFAAPAGAQTSGSSGSSGSSGGGHSAGSGGSGGGGSHASGGSSGGSSGGGGSHSGGGGNSGGGSTYNGSRHESGNGGARNGNTARSNGGNSSTGTNASTTSTFSARGDAMNARRGAAGRTAADAAANGGVPRYARPATPGSVVGSAVPIGTTPNNGNTIIIGGGGYYPGGYYPGGYYPGGYYPGYYYPGAYLPGGIGAAGYFGVSSMYGGYFDPWYGGDPMGGESIVGGGSDGTYTETGSTTGTAEIGSIRLKVKPNNAEVYVDGYYVGLVNDFDGMFQKLKIESGAHRVEIRAAGYESLVFDVRITPDHVTTYQGELKKDSVTRRSVAAASGIYDALIGVLMLAGRPLLAQIFHVALPTPPIHADLNGLFLLAVAAGYLIPYRDPDSRGGRTYLWTMGPLLKGAGAAAFLLDYAVRHSPPSFLVFAASDAAFALATLWVLLRE